MYGLTKEEREALLKILYQGREKLQWVKLFGSRARGDSRPASDLDLAIKFSGQEKAWLGDELYRSSLPYTVDLIDMATEPPPALLESIEREGRLLMEMREGRWQVTLEQLKMKLEDYRHAVSRLEEAVAKDAEHDDLYLDGTIQRFEFCYELAWKLIKHYLEYEGIEAASPRSSIREGYKAGILADAGEWLDMLEKRNLSSHTYNELTVLEIYRFIKGKYLHLLQELLQEMSRRLQ